MNAMSTKPALRRLRAAYSRMPSYTVSGIVIVPGNLMCPAAGFGPGISPSGTYASTGATIAFPSCFAISPALYFTRMLCLPSTMWGPFCSVPPVGMSTVVFPAAMASRTSTQVRFSRKTVLGFGWAKAGAAHTAKSSASANRYIPLPLFNSHAAKIDACHRSLAVDLHLLDRFDGLDAVDDAAERRVLPVEHRAGSEHDEERHIRARGILAASHRYRALHVRRIVELRLEISHEPLLRFGEGLIARRQIARLNNEA